MVCVRLDCTIEAAYSLVVLMQMVSVCQEAAGLQALTECSVSSMIGAAGSLTMSTMLLRNVSSVSLMWCDLSLAGGVTESLPANPKESSALPSTANTGVMGPPASQLGLKAGKSSPKVRLCSCCSGMLQPSATYQCVACGAPISP